MAGAAAVALERRERFVLVPAEERAVGPLQRLVVDLLEVLLADVGDDEPWALGGDVVEREAPRIAQPVAEDLIAPAPADEWVRARDPVVPSPARVTRVDAEDLAEQRPFVLRV